MRSAASDRGCLWRTRRVSTRTSGFALSATESLHESAYDVKSWNPLFPSIRASGVTGFRVRRLIEECCRAYSAWGWKDSRVCLTLGVWLDELDRLKLRDQVRLLFTSESLQVSHARW